MPAMRIWVDADACPGAIKDILYHAAERVGLPLILVANQMLRVPDSPHIECRCVPGGIDVADETIADEVAPEDLVITADIPLAAKVVDKGAHALSPRGELFTSENVQARLTMRNFMEELRNVGVATDGPAAFGPRDCHAFANQLDRFLAKNGPR